MVGYDLPTGGAVPDSAPPVAAPAAPVAQQPTPSAPSFGAIPFAPPANGQAPAVPPAAPATPDVSAVDTGNAAPAAPATPAVPDVQSQIRDLATSYGLDASQFTQFNDLQSAQAAARILLDSYAREGLNSGWGPSAEPVQQQWAPPQPGWQQPQPYVPQQPQVPTPPVAPPQFKLEFDEATVDPKLAGSLKQMEQYVTTAVKEANERAARAEQAVQQVHQQAQQAKQQEIFTRANAVVDKAASAKYGVGKNRNAAQQLAYENLLRLADGLVIGMRNRGEQIPVIEQVMQSAIFLDQQLTPTAPTPPAPQIPQVPQVPQIGVQQPGYPQAQNPWAYRAPGAPNGFQQPHAVPLEADVDFTRAALEVLRRPG